MNTEPRFREPAATPGATSQADKPSNSRAFELPTTRQRCPLLPSVRSFMGPFDELP